MWCVVCGCVWCAGVLACGRVGVGVGMGVDVFLCVFFVSYF